MSELLLPLETIIIPETTAPFHAKEELKLEKDGGICSIFGDKFREEFLSGKGLIEDPIEGHELYVYQLLQESRDNQIIKRFGGKDKVQSTLTGMVYLIRNNFLQRKRCNLFHIKNMSGVLRAVGVCRFVDGWCVSANSVKNPHAWGVGNSVFSGNSLKL